MGRGFRISEVAAQSGVKIETIRAWERRYGVIAPTRDSGNIRRYAQKDIEHLRLLNALVKRGVRIGDICGLSDAELQTYSARRQPAAVLPEGQGVVVVGQPAMPFLNAVLGQAAVKQTRVLMELADCSNPGSELKGVLVLVFQPRMNAEFVAQWLESELQQVARKVLMLYDFATSAWISQLNAAGIQTLKNPMDPAELRGLIGHYLHADSLPSDLLDKSTGAPYFTADQLASIRMRDNAIACECPRHLADIISSLVSFADYSKQCEVNSPDDAAAHAMLFSATSQARALMERALNRLAEIEGWVID